MYLIRYRCISCEHVLGMVSPSKIHHDTSEGAERKKRLGLFECIMIVLRMCFDSVYRQTRYTRDTWMHTRRCDTNNTPPSAKWLRVLYKQYPSKWLLVLFLPVVFHSLLLRGVCLFPRYTVGSCQNKLQTQKNFIGMKSTPFRPPATTTHDKPTGALPLCDDAFWNLHTPVNRS